MLITSLRQIRWFDLHLNCQLSYYSPTDFAKRDYRYALCPSNSCLPYFFWTWLDIFQILMMCGLWVYHNELETNLKVRYGPLIFDQVMCLEQWKFP